MWVTPETLDEGDPGHKVRALIRTSDGRDFQSKRVPLHELMDDRSK